MKPIPIETAKQFCEDYQKDQCIILSWDKFTGQTWVTTYGIDDENSIQATNAGKMLKDYLHLKREHEEIPTRFEQWNIYNIDRFYYASGRNYWTYVEITFWYEPHTLKRKETVREFTILTGEEYKLPDWAKSITRRQKNLDANNY